MSALASKSIHDLRSIAQSFGVADIFSKSKEHLIQAIELKQAKLVPEPPIVIPKPEYDARLMTKPPSKSSTQDDVVELLAEHVARGLHLSFPEPERWHMQWGKKEDTGTLRMPLRVVLSCANQIMK